MSAILSSDDLNDFISPGVACIKPVEVKKTQERSGEIEIGKDGEAYEVTMDGQQSKTKLDEAQINLSDCLACSGCITSAESVLVSMQSHKQVLESLKDETKKMFVVSISHQARVSLANAYNLTVEHADRKLFYLLNKLGFHHVVGTEVGRAIALEFGAQEVAQSPMKPVLSSSCPGWTCYVEKTHPHMIPYLSNVKSPQQITGSLLKRLVQKQHGYTPDEVYHLSIMPCFDKKLEASRPEFGTEEYRDVDCVITTKEIIQLLHDQEQGEFGMLDELEAVTAPENWPTDHWLSNDGSSSGGYLDYVLDSIRAQTTATTRIETIPGRNTDIVEFVVKAENDEVLAKAARVYGFRNIQNLVRKLKRKNSKVDYDYVEVMACPGGCVNGGGQIGAPAAAGGELSSKQWKDRAERLYQSMTKMSVNKQIVNDYLSLWDSSHDELLKAEFKAVDPLDNGLPKALTVGTTW